MWRSMWVEDALTSNWLVQLNCTCILQSGQWSSMIDVKDGVDGGIRIWSIAVIRVRRKPFSWSLRVSMGILCFFMAPRGTHPNFPNQVRSPSAYVLIASCTIPLYHLSPLHPPFTCYFIIVCLQPYCKLHEGRAQVCFYLTIFSQIPSILTDIQYIISKHLL